MSAILQLPRKKFTREEVERMLDQGYFIGQRYELIDGERSTKWDKMRRMLRESTVRRDGLQASWASTELGFTFH